jgi:hypothetical protein
LKLTLSGSLEGLSGLGGRKSGPGRRRNRESDNYEEGTVRERERSDRFRGEGGTKEWVKGRDGICEDRARIEHKHNSEERSAQRVSNANI